MNGKRILIHNQIQRVKNNESWNGCGIILECNIGVINSSYKGGKLGKFNTIRNASPYTAISDREGCVTVKMEKKRA